MTWSLFSIGQMANKNPHRFDAMDWSIVESCNPCHIYNDSSILAPNGSFQLSYQSDSTGSDDDYVSGVSKLCYSCHDGTIASFGHNEESNSSQINMASHHPVSVNYEFTELSKIKLKDPYLTPSELGGTIEEDMLSNGKIECTSCHDPHFSNQKIICPICPPDIGQNEDLAYYSLLKSNRYSQLCTTCHKL
jgi:hypothetical protein